MIAHASVLTNNLTKGLLQKMANRMYDPLWLAWGYVVNGDECMKQHKLKRNSADDRPTGGAFCRTGALCCSSQRILYNNAPKGNVIMRFAVAASLLIISVGCTNDLRDAHGKAVSLQRYGGLAVGCVEASPRVKDTKLADLFHKSIETRLCQYWKKDSDACVKIVLKHVHIPSIGSQLLGAQGPSASCDMAVYDRNYPDAIVGKTKVQVSINIPGRQSVITSGLIGVVMNATNVQEYNDHDRDEIVEILAGESADILIRACEREPDKQ